MKMLVRYVERRPREVRFRPCGFTDESGIGTVVQSAGK